MPWTIFAHYFSLYSMVIIFCFSFSFGTATHREEGCSNEWTLGGDRQGGLCRRGTRARILPRPQGLPSRETFVRGLDEPAGARQEAHDRGIFSQCPHELGKFELEMKVFCAKFCVNSLPFHLQDCTMFVTSFSSIQSAPASQVFKIAHKDATAEGVALATAGWVVEPRRKWLK